MSEAWVHARGVKGWGVSSHDSHVFLISREESRGLVCLFEVMRSLLIRYVYFCHQLLKFGDACKPMSNDAASVPACRVAVTSSNPDKLAAIESAFCSGFVVKSCLRGIQLPFALTCISPKSRSLWAEGAGSVDLCTAMPADSGIPHGQPWGMQHTRLLCIPNFGLPSVCRAGLPLNSRALR